jgi:hypothetical protein
VDAATATSATMMRMKSILASPHDLPADSWLAASCCQKNTSYIRPTGPAIQKYFLTAAVRAQQSNATSKSLNQPCVSWVNLESILLPRTPKLFFQQYRPKAAGLSGS